jgi:hypothetical protein
MFQVRVREGYPKKNERLSGFLHVKPALASSSSVLQEHAGDTPFTMTVMEITEKLLPWSWAP